MQYYFMIFYYLLGATVQLRFSYSGKEQFRYSNASKSVQPTTNGECKFDRFFSATTQNKKKNNICNILCKKINRTDKRKDLPVEVFIITRTFWRLFLNKPFKNLVGLKISFILCLLVRIRTRTPYCRPTTTLNERGEAA